MLGVEIICVGRLKEKYFIEAVAEYTKRLQTYCKLVITEITEAQLPKDPSAAEISAALNTEFKRMDISKRAAVFALCVEGEQPSSEELADKLSELSVKGVSKVVFIIGGSLGLSGEVKRLADYRLSMSKMTFPHHLARVLLLEQLYRAFNITEGGKYHK
jgi:23S rRNA (pseudouridine1915-N3)-methyltransferase